MISHHPIEAAGEAPLEASTWRMLLAELVNDIACSGPADQVTRLREGYVLLSRAPLRLEIDALPGPGRFAAWLAADACETAALGLLGEGAGYMVSRGDDGCIATLVLPGCDDEHSAEAATLALALLAAFAEALLNNCEAARVAPSRLLH